KSPEAYTYHWEIREESWYASHVSQLIAGIEFRAEENLVRFKAPIQEGPYRLHLMTTNNTGYYATANIPFYVLNPTNEE
ncbi:hypothetical protein, partial [Tamlana crocina]|uniref:hypothetical protein n=1 Tax=Tamlana crocina TaxID=393006 RepID=UPI001ADDAA6C